MSLNNVKQYQSMANKILSRRGVKVEKDPADPIHKSRKDQMEEIASKILKRRGVREPVIEQEPEPLEIDPYEGMSAKDLRLLLDERGVEYNVNYKRKKLIQLAKESEL